MAGVRVICGAYVCSTEVHSQSALRSIAVDVGAISKCARKCEKNIKCM